MVVKNIDAAAGWPRQARKSSKPPAPGTTAVMAKAGIYCCSIGDPVGLPCGPVQASSWRHGVTRYQWLVLFVAWLGWVFDSMDSTIYALVLHPALHDLLRGQAGGAVSPGSDRLVWRDHLLDFPHRLGHRRAWLFGVLADRFGRTRTLIFTILVYAVFTGLAAVSRDWWQLAHIPFSDGAGHRRGMGGGRGAGGGGVAGGEAGQGGGDSAIGLGGGFLFAAAVNLLMRDHGWRADFRGGRCAGGGRAVRAAVGQRAGAVGEDA